MFLLQLSHSECNDCKSWSSHRTVWVGRDLNPRKQGKWTHVQVKQKSTGIFYLLKKLLKKGVRNSNSCDARHRGSSTRSELMWTRLELSPCSQCWGWLCAHGQGSPFIMDMASSHLKRPAPSQSCQSHPISSDMNKDRRTRTKWETNWCSLSFALPIARIQGLSAIMRAWVCLSLAALQLQLQMNWCSVQPTLRPSPSGIHRTNEPPSEAQTQLNLRTIISNILRCLVSPFQLSRTGTWHSSFIKQVFDAQRWHSK